MDIMQHSHSMEYSTLKSHAALTHAATRMCPPPSFQLKEAGQRPHKEQLRTEKKTHTPGL